MATRDKDRGVNAAGERWAGVDVGAGKGFNVAVIDRHGLVAGPSGSPKYRRWCAGFASGVPAWWPSMALAHQRLRPVYAALSAAKRSSRWQVIECFPTATWSRIGGRRGKRSRARWSRQLLEGVRLEGLPSRINQDARDAIGAAVTARLYDDQKVEAFGELIVPAIRALEARSA